MSMEPLYIEWIVFINKLCQEDEKATRKLVAAMEKLPLPIIHRRITLEKDLHREMDIKRWIEKTTNYIRAWNMEYLL